jgi:N-acetylmuramic acid 6-phosphate etherase
MASAATEPTGLVGTDLVVGVDGGGSRCAAVLARATPGGGLVELGRGRGGAANVLAAGPAAAGASMLAAIEEAFAAAGIPRHPVAMACLGLAGVGRPAERGQAEAWAAGASLAARVVIVTDAELVLAGEPPWGVALIAGTGSLAIGRAPDGGAARCGGWGPLLGDEGSGYAVAVAALRAVAQMADGRGPSTDLAVRLTRRFAAADAAGLVTILGRVGTSRREIAAAAADVVEAADAGDAVAAAIVAKAGDELATQVVVVARRLGLPAGGYPLRIAGGLAVHARGLRERVIAALEEAGWPPGEVTLVADPALAAARMAATLIEL